MNVSVTHFDVLSAIKLWPSSMDPNFCSICKGAPTDRLVTECKHYYCKDCLLPWLSKSTTCPYCNKQLHRSNFGAEIDSRDEPLAEKLKLTVGAFDEDRHHQFIYFNTGHVIRQIIIVNVSNMRPQVEFSNRSDFNAILTIDESLVTVLTPLFGRRNEDNSTRIYGQSSVVIRGEYYPMFENITIHVEKSSQQLSNYEPHQKLLSAPTRWSKAFVARITAFKEHIQSLKTEKNEKVVDVKESSEKDEDSSVTIKELNQSTVNQEEGSKVKSA